MRLRVLLGSLLIALICGSAQATAPAPLPVLALTGGELGAASHVLALDPRTLEPEGSDLVLPGWAFGVEWARSPDGSQMALVPKPSETDERLVVVSSRPPLHVRVRLPLAGQDVCRLVWPSPRRLLAVATRGPACYSPIDGARLLVIDPTDGRIVSQRALTGPGTVVAAAPSPAGLSLLLKPQASSALQLLVVDSTRTKTFVIPGVRSPAGPLSKAVGSTLGLSVDATRRHAYVVEPTGRISDVDLRSGAVTLHEPAGRATSAVTKGIAAVAVQALSPAPGLLVYSGIRRTANRRLIPIGLHLIDTRTWHACLLDGQATGFGYADGTILAYQPFVEQFGRQIPRTGLHAYSASGRPRLHAFANEQVELIRTQGRYAYLSGPGGTSRLDLDSLQLQISVTNSYKFELLAGAGSLTLPP